MSVRSQASVSSNDQVGKKLLDSLQADLRVISNECKKRMPQIKEAAEAGIVKLRSASSKHQDLRLALLSESPELLEPFFMACDTKVPKIVQVSLGAIQRLISYKAISATAGETLINCLWSLMANEIEELKLLQTATLLISTNDTIQGEALSGGLAICFRLHFTKNQTVNNAASATIRQLISFIFERVQKEDKENEQENSSEPEINLEELKIGTKSPPSSLKPHAQDAFMLFQDFLQLVNGDQPLWLMGLIEMTRAFGLELLEIVLSNFSDIFYRHVEFRFLLKEKVSPLVIKLFSPNIKYKPHLGALQAQHQQTSNQQVSNDSQNNLTSLDKPIFPISARLLRIVAVLVQNYYSLLVTECEIFLSLLIKLLENDKPSWQKSLALEAIHKMCQHPDLLRSFCQSYDMKENSSKILRDMIIALGVFCQSIFISPPITPSLLTSLINAASAASSSTNPPSNIANVNQIGSNSGASLQAAFMLRGTLVPLAFTMNLGQNKSYFMDQLDKLEAPPVPDGHGLTQAFYCLLEVVESISIIIDGSKDTSANGTDLVNSSQSTSSESLIFKNKMKKVDELDVDVRRLHESLLDSTWTGLVSAFSLLLEASTDETISELILKSMERLTTYYGLYGVVKAREAIIIAMCRTSLPIGYKLPLLIYEIPVASENSSPASLTPSTSSATVFTSTAGHSRSSSYDFSNQWAKSNLKLLSTNASVLQQSQPSPPSLSSSSLYARGSPLSESSDFRQQVVAVGTPLPSPHLANNQPGPVMLTAKNLQCMKSVLTVSHSCGAALEGSWYIVLTTLQHLAWILDLRPSTGGSLKVSKTVNEPGAGGASNNAVITTAAMLDLPVLSAMLSRLFESSQELDDDALLHLINALTKLSTEAMEIAYNNREPSLFAVAKLLETSLVNLNRRKLIWKTVTAHLLLVCQHPQIRMREWGVEALTCLVKNVFTLKDSEKGEKITFLSPLQEMSGISYADIRQKQLDCVIQILQSSGESLGEGWPQILDIIGAINDQQSENLIRIAFQCVQLIIRDYLSSISALCLVLVVDTVAKFGSQTQEMNVALTAVSSLWDTADFFFQNRKVIEENLDDQNIPSGDDSKDPNSVLPAYDCLWMSLFVKLGDLCTDPRPSLRKSASQTLFATLTTHGEIVNTRLWSGVLWQVLFPLLDRVRHLSNSATDEKLVESSKFMSGSLVNGNSGSIMLHHSRNTAQKQWSETQVLTLCGVSRIFCLKRDQFLSSLDHFEKAWTLLLDHIESSAQSRIAEVSLTALKCFQDVLCASPSSPSLITTNSSLPQDTYTPPSSPSSSSPLFLSPAHKKLCLTAWKIWLNIGNYHWNMACQELIDTNSLNGKTNTKNKKEQQALISNYPSQTFLSALIQIFPYIFQLIKDSFNIDDFNKLFAVFERALCTPIDVATQAYMMNVNVHHDSQNNLVPLTPLQEAIIFVMEQFQNDIMTNLSQRESLIHSEKLLPALINQYLTFSSYASQPPNFKHFALQSPNNKFLTTSELTAASLIPFGERCMKSAINLYQSTASWAPVVQENVLHSIIKFLRIPLSLKYSCPSHSTWKLAHQCLMTAFTSGLPIARQHYTDDTAFWTEVLSTLESFLFPTSKPPLIQGLEDQQMDEAYDVKIIKLIRDSILPFAAQMPREFVLQIVSLLNRGSIHSATSGSPIDTESSRNLREEFARCCFETLLRFSFLGPKGNPNLFVHAAASPTGNAFAMNQRPEIGLVNKLVVTSLLQRFHEVVIKYVDDEKLSGKCPLPRHRMAEITFVLQALATLAASMKKASSDSVETGVWEQLISLYPHLVDCTVSNCAQVNRALREVLHEYKDLLHPPVNPSLPQKPLINGTIET